MEFTWTYLKTFVKLSHKAVSAGNGLKGNQIPTISFQVKRTGVFMSYAGKPMCQNNR